MKTQLGTLSDLFNQPDHMRGGNPFPLRGVALCFENGRARVMVQNTNSDDWVELLSAPAVSPEGLEGVACAIDLTADFGCVFADLGIAKGPA
jgi:hypothetical protein